MFISSVKNGVFIFQTYTPCIFAYQVETTVVNVVVDWLAFLVLKKNFYFEYDQNHYILSSANCVRKITVWQELDFLLRNIYSVISEYFQTEETNLDFYLAY